jgi:hypothetical protein
VLSILLYAGGLLLVLVIINVVLTRTIRAEKRREREGQRSRR